MTPEEKIAFLQEEIKRRDEKIDEIRKENLILTKVALKRAQRKHS
ncbi:MAG: hypothetical protein ABIA93_05510 [Candidatus Woesearchaeota archaeon]